MTSIAQVPWRNLVIDAILSPDFRRATFGGAVRGQGVCRWSRVVLRPIELRGERFVQFSYFDAKKDLTKNFQGSEIATKLGELFDVGFAGIHITTRTEEIDVRMTKKGSVSIGRKKNSADVPALPQSHNRVKDLPLPEGRANRLLEALGILTRDGQVRSTMRAKYTQINEFLKQLTHVLADTELRALGRPLEILDAGCGSSYLTLAAHHYLNDVLAVPANLIGVDVNEELIRKSGARSEHLGAGAKFVCAPIGKVAMKPDIVFALHACDTATDDALALAVHSEAKIVLSVPCCHHDLNAKLHASGPAEVVRPLLRHGILHERTADLVTDAFRALALRIMGYKTEVVEFVSPEHTARNLMIRAIRGAPIGEKSFVNEYLELRRFWGVTPYIESALGETFQRLLEIR
jgi:SAM-dependent methyltransferase